MARLRHLSGGKWNKPPVLTAARRILIEALRSHTTSRPLGEMAEFVNGTSYRSDLIAEEGTPIIRISNITDPKSDFLKTTESFEDKYKVDSGDLLVSWSASFKSIIWPGPPSVLNQHIFRVRERSQNNRSFIRHAIEAVFDEMRQKVVGIGMMHLRRSDFIGHEIPCPSPEIQLAVSRYLDWIESGCDGEEPSLPKLLDHQRRVIARIEELAARIQEVKALRYLSSREVELLLSATFDSAFGATAAQRARVGDFVKIQSGYAFKSEWFTESGVRLVRNANIGHGKIDWAETVYIPDSRRSEFAAFELKEGDILVSLDRPIISSGIKLAKVERRDLPSLLLQRVGRPRFTTDKVMPDYFLAWLKSPRFTTAIDPGRSNGVPHISPKDVEAISFQPPSLQEQQKVVVFLAQLEKTEDGIKRLQAETAVEIEALMPSILSKAFRGEL